MEQTLVVVGASLSGLATARAARAQGFSGRLVIVGEEINRPYDRPPLSKAFLAGKISLDDLALEEPGEELDAEWLLGVRAEGFNAETMTLSLSNGHSIAADAVVIATGASARTLPQLADKENVFTLRTVEDAQALQKELLPGRRMVVIGAGFIGAETASTAQAMGVDVTILERSASPLRGPLGPSMGAVVAGLHAKNGVELLCGTGVSFFSGTDTAVTGVVLDDGRELPADIVLVGIGAQPNVDWLQGSGIALDNGVLCDSMGRTNVTGVSAVGDCAAWYDPRSQTYLRVEHWTGAMERPALAVTGLFDQYADAEPVNPAYFWSDQYQSRIQFAGNAHVADRVEIAAGDVSGPGFLAVYYAGAEPVAALGVNQVRLFTRWRKTLNKSSTPYAAFVASPEFDHANTADAVGGSAGIDDSLEGAAAPAESQGSAAQQYASAS